MQNYNFELILKNCTILSICFKTPMYQRSALKKNKKLFTIYK